MKKKVTIAILAVFVLAIAIIIGTRFTNEVKMTAEDRRAMTYEQVTDDDAVDGTDFVKFGAYFLRDLNKDGEAELLLGTCKELGSSDDLYINLNVLTEGYLEDAVITIDSNNFCLKTQEVTNGDLKTDYVGEDVGKIEFNTLNAGTQKLIIGQVRSGIYSDGEKNSALGNNINNYTASNTVTLTGTHVDDEGNKTHIEKTVPLTVDWYGSISTEIEEYCINQVNEINGQMPQDSEGVILNVKIAASESGGLLLKSNHMEGTIPKLKGYDPISVKCSSTMVDFNYDEETRTFTLDREAVVDEVTGDILKKVSSFNDYKLVIKYPLEAYEAVGGDGMAISFPIKAVYTGFNNQNDEFTNPYVSEDQDIVSVSYRRPVGKNVRIKVNVGEYHFETVDGIEYERAISKELPLNIYNGIDNQEVKDEYMVKWIVDTGSEPADAGLLIIDDPANPTDRFNSTDGSSKTMEEYSKCTGIYFRNTISLLGSDGWIEVYNADTNELIRRFEGAELEECNEENPYYYSSPITHVKILTSKYRGNSSMSINHIKELNDTLITNDYTLENFSKIKSISSYVEGSMVFDDGSIVRVNSELDAALYTYPYSSATIETDKTWISSQNVQENVGFKINTYTDGIIRSEWKDGIFLVKFPEEFYYLKAKSVTGNVNVDSYEVVDIDGCKGIKIYTSNAEPTEIELFINTDIACNPAVITKTANYYLYAENMACKYYRNNTEDTYDINYNNNTSEKIMISKSSIDIVSPTALITSQELSNYDDEGTKTLAPGIADFESTREDRNARVTIKMINNYNSTITETSVIGKTPHIGNTYPINGKEMGSQFNTTMKGGIVVPDELKDVVTVYYSTQEKVTKDLNSRANDWKTNPEDFSKIKSYMIDFGDYTIEKGKSFDFYYDVDVEEDVPINQISYANHAVYFALNTNEGKYYTQTEPSKLGIRITKKYNLSLTKFEKGTAKVIPNTVYKLVDVTTDEAKTAVTDENGNLVFEKLYSGRQYKLRELKSNEDYIYESNEISFIVNSVDGENITLNVLSGNLKTEPTIDNNQVVNFQTENEVKYNLKLTKYDETSRNALADVKFSVNGGGYINKIFATNSDGILNINGLIPGTEYTLKETEANGYYIRGDSIVFKVERNGENLELNVISGQFVDNPSITTNNESARPTINIDYTNEKVPTYDLVIQKYREGTTDPVENVKFVINGPTVKNKVYETDAQGKIYLEGLYLYDPTRDQEATYTLRETYAPEGFEVITDPIEFSISKDGDNLVVNSISNNELPYEFDQENNKFILTIPNRANLRIIKTDKDTGEPMPNVEFYLFNEDDEGFGEDSQKTFVEKEMRYSNNFNYNENTDEYTLEEGNTYGYADIMLEMPEGGTLEFEWIPEISDSNGKLTCTIRDYNYRTIYSKSLNGIVYSGMIAQNLFESEKIQLPEGSYTVEFNANNIDQAIIKNLKAYYGRNNGIKYVTDENGKINASIPNGRYELRENTPEGYEKIEPIKLGFGESYDKHKALEFLSSEIVDEVVSDEYRKPRKKYDFGNNLYMEYFEKRFEDSESDFTLTSNYSCSYILYKRNEQGQIINYVLYESSYSDFKLSPEEIIFIDDDNNVYFIDYVTYRISDSKNGYNQRLIKYDENLNKIEEKSNSDYGFLKLNIEDGKKVVYLSKSLSNTRQNTVFGYNFSSGVNGTNYLRVEFDEDLNVNNVKILGGIQLSKKANNYVTISVNSNAMVGQKVFNYTIEENDVGKTILIKLDKNENTIIDKYKTSSCDVYNISELDDCKVITLSVNTEVTLENGTNIQTGENNSYNTIFIKYDNDNNYISSQYVTGATPESVSYLYDDIYFGLYKDQDNVTINGTAEVEQSNERSMIGRYNVECGIIDAYANVTSSRMSKIEKINDNLFVYYNGGLIRAMDYNFNKVWENGIISNSKDGPTWIDNIIEMEDGSLVMTYNLRYEYHPPMLAGVGIQESYSTNNYYYEGPWTESYLVKYDTEGNLLFIRGINNIDSNIKKYDEYIKIGSGQTCRIQVDRLDVDTSDPNDTKYIVYGDTNSNAEIQDNGYNKIIYHEIDAYEYPESTVLEIQNEKSSLKHNIYTSYMNEEDGLHGNITGWADGETRTYSNREKHIETVKDGQNSTKEITIKPNDGYVIGEIAIDYAIPNEDGFYEIVGSEFYSFENIYKYGKFLNDDGSVTIPVFENVTSDIGVYTTFYPAPAEIEVNHYIKGTTTKVAPSKTLYGFPDEEYTTSPYADLTDYELEKDEEGNLILPDNKVGVFTEEKQVVNYYYVPKEAKLIVHHYLEGTEYSLAPDEVSSVNISEAYTTHQAVSPTIEEKYVKISDSGNTDGVINEKITEVIYYYNIATHDITTEVDGVGGSIYGQGQAPYETVLHEQDSTKEIKIIPEDGYRINTITVNGSEIEFTPQEDGTFTLPIFTHMTEDEHVVVSFIPNKYTITITKQWEDNEDENEKRPTSVLIDMLYEDETIKEIELTQPWTTTYNIDTVDESGNSLDFNKISFIEKEVNSNDLEFYDEELDYSLDSQTGVITVNVTNTYRIPEITKEITFTKQWEDNSNEYSKRPEQIKIVAKNGESVVKEIVVDVTEENTITGTIYGLPYYDENGQEITYTIDEIEVNENDLKFYSKQIDQTSFTITNTFTVPEDKTSIDVTKIWSDNSNENATRPAQIKLQVKDGDTVVQEQVVNVDNTTDEKVYTFENLALYNSTGEEIVYTVDELEVNENDLIGYTKSIDGNTITNTIIKHKITTEVNGQGGTISGENEDPYEEVNHKGNSVKDVVITPEPGYKIKNITINDEPQDLPEDAFSEYTLDKFEEMTEDKHIVVEFELVEHVITTEVEGVGGTISGQGSTKQNPHETVIHGNNSTKDIVVTPDSGYKITSITVNGNAIEFAPQNDGTYTLPIFENMTEDKHVVVKFERKETSVVVKHQTEDGTDLVDPETIPGRVGDEYTTEPKDFPDYDLKTTPDNAEGNMTEEQIEVIYVYSKVKGTVTVTKVDKTDNSILLEGAVFKLEKLNDSDEIDQTFEAREERTNTQGKAVFEDLEVGKYRLTEIQAPQNYELTNEVVDLEVTKAERDVSIVAKDRMKIVLPATGKINYSIVVTGIGLVVIATAFILKKNDKKASQE